MGSSNSPGSPFGADRLSRTGTLFFQLEHGGFLGSSYGIPLTELQALVKKGYDEATAVKKERPASHSAYSSRLPDSHRSKMHSRDLPMQ